MLTPERILYFDVLAQKMNLHPQKITLGTVAASFSYMELYIFAKLQIWMNSFLLFLASEAGSECSLTQVKLS